MRETRRGEMDGASKDLILVRKLEDIPKFADEDEEDEFWSTHELAEHLYTRRGPSPRSRCILGLPPLKEERSR